MTVRDTDGTTIEDAAAFETYAQTFRSAAADLRSARRVALQVEARDVERDTWEWRGRRWYWPGGEEMRYFADLSPLERRVLGTVEDASGFRLLAAGTARVALQFPPESGLGEYVVKLPRHGVSADLSDGVHLAGFDGGDGRRQNRVEAERWARRETDDGPLLPVVAADDDGEWLVMPRATPLNDVVEDSSTASVDVADANDGNANDRDLDDADDVLARLESALREDYSNLLDGDELVPENVGRWRGEWFLFDYGRVLPSADG